MTHFVCAFALASSALAVAPTNHIANLPYRPGHHICSEDGWRVMARNETPPGPIAEGRDAGAKREHPILERSHPGEVIDVNRPRSVFDCELPIGESWYGSRERCLAYMCGGQNVYNEYIFDADNRRRKNPCYGQNPLEFPSE